MSSRTSAGFAIIHAIISIAAPIVIVLLVSCLEAEEDPISFGPETSALNVATALNEPFANLSPESILQGEFVHIETSQSLNGGSKFVTQDTGITIISRQESATDITLGLATEEITYDSDGNSEQAIFENTATIQKTSLASTLELSSNLKTMPVFGLNKTVETQAETISICQPTNNSSVTFHNLDVQNETSSVPTLVEGSSFCQGKSPCLIPKTIINYDQVIAKEGGADKIHCEFVYSSEVPFLGVQLKKCITLVVPIEGRSVLLTECSEVKNFKFGE